MHDSYAWYLFKRFLTIALLVGGFCLLPGPRRLVGYGLDYLLTPESQQSLWAGFHLSVIHICWLFDLDMQLLPYPEEVDPLLANLALLIGIAGQLCIATLVWAAGRFVFVYYDPERPTEEEDNDEELAVAPPEVDLHVKRVDNATPEKTYRAG